ncbi:MAG TPA: hypothetical protein VGM59_09220 [Dongiaceae bacterium]|jgi:hypothetical protein
MRITLIGLAVAACLVSGHAMAADTVDCSKLDLSFKADHWKVKCYDNTSMGSVDYAYNQDAVQELAATHGTEILEVIDQRASSSRVYFTRSGTRQYIEQTFKHVPVNDWSDQESIGDFDVGYFDSTMDGQDVKCIGFSHYGRNRVVDGISCTADGDYKKAAEALQFLSR